MKKKWICTVCGYVHEGDEAPEFCPQCKQPKSKFKELVETTGALQFVDEHVSTIQYTKCVKTKPAMVKVSKDYITVISNNNVQFVNTIGLGVPRGYSLFLAL